MRVPAKSNGAEKGMATTQHTPPQYRNPIADEPTEEDEDWEEIIEYGESLATQGNPLPDQSHPDCSAAIS
jgi:hypothetical protein